MINKNKSICLMLFSAFSFSAMQIIVKLLNNIPLMEKVFFRNLLSLIMTIIIINKKRLRFIGLKENRKNLFYRSLFGYLGVVLFFYATSQMIAADAAILNKLSPVFVTVLAYFFLKEKINKTQLLSLVISFVGAYLVIRPELNYSIIPAATGLLSAAVSAAAYIFITLIGDKESIYTIVFFFSLFSAVCSIPFILFSYVVPNMFELFLLLLLGLLAALGQIALTYAYNSCPASEISAYDYTNILFSLVLGYFILKELPDLFSIFGGFLIIAASLSVYIYNKSKSN